MPLSAFTNTFAGNPLDRSGDRRGDEAWIAEQWAQPASRACALWNAQPLTDAAGIVWLDAGLAQSLAPSDEHRLFLGLDGEAPVFAIDLEGLAEPQMARGRFAELRALAPTLSGDDAAILACARSLFEWRRRHGHCAACGQQTRVADAGWKRQCPACKAEHFPRTDPVAIMLPFHGGRCMLARQERWPPGMFSALAGFIEPGESIEEACARELAEEAGLRTLTVRYHSSQPWPFPSQLMIGLLAEVEDDEGAPDQTEISEIRWFTRDEARDLLAGRIEGIFCPPPLAIAHQLLKAWVEN